MNYYDSVYKNNPEILKNNPSKLMTKASGIIPKKGRFLDLGCGQGRDSFYMVQKNFRVTAVDNSKVAISQIKNILKEKKINTIETIRQDISKFKITPKNFNVISCHNALQFIPKKSALKVIERIKKNILPGGVIIIASFVSNARLLDRNKARFKAGEIKELFSTTDFKIYYYFEGALNDKGHIGHPKPHRHQVVQIIVQKPV